MRTDRYFEINGARLRYRDEGKGPALLLIHGWTLDLDMWEPQARDLSQTFRVIRFDRRGFGLSSGRPGLAADAADAEALCGHLGIQHVASVGMSQGARVLQLLAAAAPRLISSVVLDGAPDLRPGGRLTADDIPLAQLSSLLQNGGIEAFRREWTRHPLARLVTSNTRAQELLRKMIGRYSASDLVAGLPGSAKAAAPAVCVQPLQAIRVPALVLNGRFDIASRRRAGVALAQTLKFSERVVVARSGHLANLDNPSAYNSALKRFLERRPTSSLTHMPHAVNAAAIHGLAACPSGYPTRVASRL